MRGYGSKKGFIYKNNILNHENIEKGVLPKMQKTIEVVYEKGVFKPLEPVELEEGEKIKVDIKKLPEKLFGIFRGKDLLKLLEETEDEWGIY